MKKYSTSFGIICIFEEIKAELGGTAYGERVTEIRLIGLMKGYSSGVQDTMYSIDDLRKKPVKQNPNADNTVADVNADIDVFDDDDI